MKTLKITITQHWYCSDQCNTLHVVICMSEYWRVKNGMKSGLLNNWLDYQLLLYIVICSNFDIETPLITTILLNITHPVYITPADYHTKYIVLNYLYLCVIVEWLYTSIYPSISYFFIRTSLILPYMDLLDYCSVVWNSCSQTLSNNIERVQNYVMRLTLNKPPLTRSEPLRQFLSWSTLKERRDKSTLIRVHRCTSGVSAVSSLSFVKVPSKLKPRELSREKR